MFSTVGNVQTEADNLALNSILPCYFNYTKSPLKKPQIKYF